MTVKEFIDKLLRRQPASAETAKERLQLVLAHDRSDLNPELLEQMRREILEVVARYVEIDLAEGDVSLETEDRVTFCEVDLHVAGHHFENLAAHLLEQLRIEVAAVVGQHQLETLFGCFCTGGLTAQELSLIHI